MTLSNADKLRFAEVEDRITREFGDSDTMDFLEYLKTQGVENRLRQVRQDSLEESIEFLVNECGELQKEVNEYRQQEETKLTETLDLTYLERLKEDGLELKEENNVFASENADYRFEVRDLEGEVEYLENEISRLKCELDKAENTITHLEGELEAWVESQT